MCFYPLHITQTHDAAHRSLGGQDECFQEHAHGEVRGQDDDLVDALFAFAVCVEDAAFEREAKVQQVLCQLWHLEVSVGTHAERSDNGRTVS